MVVRTSAERTTMREEPRDLAGRRVGESDMAVNTRSAC
jgi:hypothetical protein